MRALVVGTFCNMELLSLAHRSAGGESKWRTIYPKPLYYEQIGQQGRPMLFIPFDPTTIGSGCMKPHAFRAYRTVAVDLAGYGRSSR